jgi:hypothetical protein
MTYAVVIGTLGVLGFGLLVVAMLVLTSIRRRKDWAGPSPVLTDEERAGLQEPANLGAETAGDGGAGAETQAVSSVQYRTETNLTNGL